MGLAKTIAARFPEWGAEFATLMVSLPAAHSHPCCWGSCLATSVVHCTSASLCLATEKPQTKKKVDAAVQSWWKPQAKQQLHIVNLAQQSDENDPQGGRRKKEGGGEKVGFHFSEQTYHWKGTRVDCLIVTLQTACQEQPDPT